MLSEEDYINARERIPEPSRTKQDHMMFCKIPTLVMEDDVILPFVKIEEGYFKRKLIRKGGVTFWAWVANKKIYY